MVFPSQLSAGESGPWIRDPVLNQSPPEAGRCSTAADGVEGPPAASNRNMSPQNRSGEISLCQRLLYVIHLQTVWRLYGDGVEIHRFSVPADGDQDDLTVPRASR